MLVDEINLLIKYVVCMNVMESLSNFSLIEIKVSISWVQEGEAVVWAAEFEPTGKPLVRSQI